MREYDLVVVGGGAAGLTSGLFGTRYGLKTIVLERMVTGGQIINVEQIENYPGFPQGISGAELGLSIQQQAMDNGCEMEMIEVTRLVPEESYFTLETAEEAFQTKAVIIATGSTLRRPGVPGEDEYEGRGISYCATCDGPLFTEKDVGVVGGGDSAADEALTLTQYASKVILFHRRNQLRAQQVLRDRVLAHPQIEVRWNTEVTEVLGEGDGVSGVRVQDTQTGETSEVELAGLFIYAGMEPNTAFLKGIVEMDNAGHIATDLSMQTSLPGIYAAGDIRQKSAGQVLTSAADGATAAIHAASYIASLW